MTAVLLTAPIIISFLTAIACFLARHDRVAQRWLSLLGSIALLIASFLLAAEVIRHGPIAAAMGGWLPPFGIVLVADLFAVSMVVISAIIAVTTTIYSFGEVTDGEERFGFHTLLHSLLAGGCGAFLTGDIFNLYVWFEVMLIASFGLLILGGRKEQIDGAVKYVVLNLISTIAFLTGIGLIYGATGTLNMAELRDAIPAIENDTVVLTTAVIFLFGFGVKAALFPVFFWLPASYHTPAVVVSSLFTALMTKVGVYALIRFFTLMYDTQMPQMQTMLLIIAAFTMVVGVLGAAAQNSIRRILAFHSVSQIGYILLGLAIFTPLALVGAIFFIIHHIVVKANLFLVGGVMTRLTGSEDLAKIGGLWRRTPWLAVLFLLPALSLAGLPPFFGFWAKLVVIQASFEADAYLYGFIALFVGLLTMYSMSKIWMEGFWKAHPNPSGAAALSLSRNELALLVAPIVLLTVATTALGLFASPFFDIAVQAAAQLTETDAYVRAVLGTLP
ncbi:MAG: Na+/H+ antiporter subunit D [Geminicoccaceae bacterium]|nr:MAG: Na+/H+ antiporter subunit D [Geminicoccaceae bacterium]